MEGIIGRILDVINSTARLAVYHAKDIPEEKEYHLKNLNGAQDIFEIGRSCSSTMMPSGMTSKYAIGRLGTTSLAYTTLLLSPHNPIWKLQHPESVNCES